MEHGRQGAARRLVIVDEAIDFVQERFATEYDVKQLAMVLPSQIEAKFPNECRMIEHAREVLRASKNGPAWIAQAYVPLDGIDVKTLDWHALYKAIGEIRRSAGPRGRRKLAKDDVAYYRDTLIALKDLLASWDTVYWKSTDRTLTTARSILPVDHPISAVVLDATAGQNHIYDLGKETFQVLAVPRARTYGNVSVRMAYVAGTGKGAMTTRAKSIARDTAGAVAQRYERDDARRVFVVTHQDWEALVEQEFASVFDDVMVTHWNQIDGRNDWNDRDTVVILSLPYRNDAAGRNTLQAMQGPMSTEALNNPPAIVGAIEASQMAVDVVQAINRARCRRVVDDHGRCEPVDVYIRLPRDAKGSRREKAEAIVEAVRDTMPDVVIEDWVIEETTIEKTAAAPTAVQVVAEHLLKMQPGRSVKARDVQKAVRLSTRTWRRILHAMRTPGSPLAVALTAIGVTYEMEATADGRRAWFRRSGEPVCH